MAVLEKERECQIFQIRLASCIAVIPLLYPCSCRGRSCTNTGNADASENSLLYAADLALLAICIRRECIMNPICRERYVTMKKCKLTILKTTLQEDLAKEYGIPGFSTCPLMKDRFSIRILRNRMAFVMKHGRRFISMCLPWRMDLKGGMTIPGSIPGTRV